MAKSGINIRKKKNNIFRSLDVIYDLEDSEFKNWVNTKVDYRFEGHRLTVAERYKVVEEMHDHGIRLYVDEDVLASEEWWDDNSIEKGPSV